MDINIFSNNPDIEKSFTEIAESDQNKIAVYSTESLKKRIKNLKPESIVYLDISDYPGMDMEKILLYLSNRNNLSYGIIDPKDKIIDIPMLFYNNAIDYLGSELLKNGLSQERLNKTLSFLNKKKQLKTRKSKGKYTSDVKYIYSGNNWNKIEAGNEYSFCLMFIELDNQKELKEKFSTEKREELINAFHDDIRDAVLKSNGKIWIWLDFGGIILFPFDGKSCDAIVTCFELVLNRNIISIDNYNYNYMLSYRIVLHIGNTVYKKKGDTGKIYSDSINTIFKIGSQYAKPGSYLITENLFEFIPDGLDECFIFKGEFSGRKIRKMILI